MSSTAATSKHKRIPRARAAAADNAAAARWTASDCWLKACISSFIPSLAMLTHLPMLGFEKMKIHIRQWVVAGHLRSLPFSLDGMRVREMTGDDYRTSHWEVKWANDLFLMNF